MKIYLWVSAKAEIGVGATESDSLSEELLTSAVAGNRRSLSKLISALENSDVSGDSLGLSRPSNTNSVIGITGAPGSGKSCLIQALLEEWTSQGKKVAVLAIDPSSPLTGGALLGDRVRMQSADDNELVFVRSIATRGQPGGMPYIVGDAANLMLKCGYEIVLIETVGTGQSEIRIVSVADRIVLVESPSRGDEIQAEKAGVMELADLVVMNKSDLEDAGKSASQISSALSINENPTDVILTSTKTGSGISELASTLLSLPVNNSAELARAREQLLAAWASKLLNREDFLNTIDGIICGDYSPQEWVDENTGW